MIKKNRTQNNVQKKLKTLKKSWIIITSLLKSDKRTRDEILKEYKEIKNLDLVEKKNIDYSSKSESSEYIKQIIPMVKSPIFKIKRNIN